MKREINTLKEWICMLDHFFSRNFTEYTEFIIPVADSKHSATASEVVVYACLDRLGAFQPLDRVVVMILKLLVFRVKNLTEFFYVFCSSITSQYWKEVKVTLALKKGSWLCQHMIFLNTTKVSFSYNMMSSMSHVMFQIISVETDASGRSFSARGQPCAGARGYEANVQGSTQKIFTTTTTKKPPSICGKIFQEIQNLGAKKVNFLRHHCIVNKRKIIIKGTIFAAYAKVWISIMLKPFWYLKSTLCHIHCF